MKKTVCYIAGPYSAETPRKTQDNIRAASIIALSVWKQGNVAYCPHMNTALFDGECPRETWLDGHIEMLRRSDKLILVPGWEASEGTRQEIYEAIRCGIPIEIWKGEI